VIETARREMAGAMNLSVPLKVDAGFGPDWSEAH
jgi:DNA polymerase I-like protein with 3'-5' exonuclease and polymerase domains